MIVVHEKSPQLSPKCCLNIEITGTGRLSKFTSVTIPCDICLFRKEDEGSRNKHCVFICPIKKKEKITSFLSKTRTNFGLNVLWACKPCLIALRGTLGKYSVLFVRNFR